MIRYKHRNTITAVAGCSFLILSTAATCQALSLTYSGLLLYSTGKYIFTQRTNSVHLYNGITASGGIFSVSVSVPLIHQNTPWISLTGAGMIPSGGTQHGMVRQVRRENPKAQVALVDTTQYNNFGVGDPLVHLAMEIIKEKRALPSVKLTGDVKPPLASASHGFGTGKWDYAGGVSLAKTFGNTFLFLDASYWELGNQPNQEFHNPLVYGVSLGHAFSQGRYAGLLGLSGDTRIQDDVDPPMQAHVVGSYRLSGRVNLNANLGVGLTESTPDFIAGIGWRIAL
jgi:hypothetical protein